MIEKQKQDLILQDLKGKIRVILRIRPFYDEQRSMTDIFMNDDDTNSSINSGIYVKDKGIKNI